MLKILIFIFKKHKLIEFKINKDEEVFINNIDAS